MEIASVISDLGDVQYLHAKPVIEGYLNHPEAWVRRNAIQALTIDFKAQEHRTTCEIMIRDETDFDARNVAISGLGQLLRFAPGLTGIKILAALVRNPNEEIVHREAAYQGILWIKGVDPREHPWFKEGFVEEIVDWNMISRIEAGLPP